MEKQWAMIWHQAMTQSFLNGKAFGKNRTAAFQICSPSDGEQIRLRFSNRFAKYPYEIGAVTIVSKGRPVPVTLNGRKTFSVPPVGTVFSDPVSLSLHPGDRLEIRLYYTNEILDNNMIEEEATLLNGDQTEAAGPLPFRKPLLARMLGAYAGIPALEAVEILAAEPPRAIVAFGDSITAMSRWTKPLAKRLAETYPGEYALLNSGISGNCLLIERGGIFGPVFGASGVNRFGQDVLSIPRLHAVILALGVNDVAAIYEKDGAKITLDHFRDAVTDISRQLHERDVRVIIQTITPRLGVSRTMGRYTAEMEQLRLAFNSWIRTADLFDYVFDAEAAVSETRTDGLYFAEGLHQGDRLHPNADGGRKLADAYDLAGLTGK